MPSDPPQMVRMTGRGYCRVMIVRNVLPAVLGMCEKTRTLLFFIS